MPLAFAILYSCHLARRKPYIAWLATYRIKDISLVRSTNIAEAHFLTECASSNVFLFDLKKLDPTSIGKWPVLKRNKGKTHVVAEHRYLSCTLRKISRTEKTNSVVKCASRTADKSLAVSREGNVLAAYFVNGNIKGKRSPLNRRVSSDNIPSRI